MKTHRGADTGLKRHPRQPVPADTLLQDSQGTVDLHSKTWRENLGIYLLILVATVAVYANVGQFQFISWDDPFDVVNNVHVTGGITLDGVKWALTSVEDSNWMPLTRLSHMLDAELFGLQPGWHHVSNLLFHLLAALLLFAFLNRATGARWCSAFVALIFSLHPLHVESVAWVTERKDVLSGLLWFLTLWAYVRYTERPEWRSYVLTLSCFCLALMAKSMAVSLPFVLLLLDFWPLRRMAPPLALPAGDKPRERTLIHWTQAVREKIPFFAISAACCTVTYVVQQSGGAVKGFSAYPGWLRVENAAIAYIVYIAQTLWPANLAVIYPYPHSLPLWQAGFAAILLAGMSVAALRTMRAYPYVATGWFWYLGTLVPVIGLIQIGSQARADRYIYIPMTGLLIALTWGAADILRRWPRARAYLAVAACLCAAAVTAVQVQYWKNSLALFQHALDATDNDNYIAHAHVGMYLALNVPERLPGAIDHLETAVRIKPDLWEAQSNLGMALIKSGRPAEAIGHLETALRIYPDIALAQCNLGMLLLNIPGRLPEAISHLEAAIRLQPDYAEAHADLASALLQIPGRLPEAVSHYEAAVRAKPESAEVHYDLAQALSLMPDRLPEAVDQFEAAIRLSPDADTHYKLALVLLKIPGRQKEFLSHLQAALRMDPNFEPARQMMDRLRAAQTQLGGR